LGFTEADGGHTLGSYPPLHEGVAYSFRATFGKGLVIGLRSGAVGMTLNLHHRCLNDRANLNAYFLYYAIKMCRSSDDIELPMKTFKYSISYLGFLFCALLIDHYLLFQVSF